MMHSPDTKKLVLNGPRPSPLKVNKDSHVIQRKPPVIIYTHSPKVIHTKPKDFRALVQKLTGCSRSEECVEKIPTAYEDTAASPDSTASGGDDHDKFECSGSEYVSSLYKGHPFFGDFPLFTPNMFSSSTHQPVFRYVAPPSNVSLSPSFVEYDVLRDQKYI